MRIIGGTRRGLKLAEVGDGDAAAHLRPTSDRVREAIFNLLINAHGNPVSGARVLDLFAGTGALGMGEAALVSAIAGGWLAPGTVVVWEESAAPQPPAGLVQVDQRKYGDTVVTLLKAAA